MFFTTLGNVLGNGTPTFNEYRDQKVRSRRTDLAREDGLVIELLLHPGHQVVDVLGSGELDGLLHLGAVGPQVLVPGREVREAMIVISGGRTWGLQTSLDRSGGCRTR